MNIEYRIYSVQTERLSRAAAPTFAKSSLEEKIEKLENWKKKKKKKKTLEKQKNQKDKKKKKNITCRSNPERAPTKIQKLFSRIFFFFFPRVTIPASSCENPLLPPPPANRCPEICGVCGVSLPGTKRKPLAFGLSLALNLRRHITHQTHSIQNNAVATGIAFRCLASL